MRDFAQNEGQNDTRDCDRSWQNMKKISFEGFLETRYEKVGIPTIIPAPLDLENRCLVYNCHRYSVFRITPFPWPPGLLFGPFWDTCAIHFHKNALGKDSRKNTKIQLSTRCPLGTKLHLKWAWKCITFQVFLKDFRSFGVMWTKGRFWMPLACTSGHKMLKM